ncbi:MAG: hypothetical protein ACO2O0_09945 [Desulfurococcales archaeon]|nr:hypothetical protein [Desulfurococcales archaeon]
MSQQTKSKELKIVTKPVIALESVKNNKRAMKVLYLISELGSVTEKGLSYVIKELSSAGVDLGYRFLEIAGIPTSKELREDIISMLYVGLLESSQGKKLSVTSQGKEVLSQIQLEQGYIDALKSKLPEIKTKLATILAEADLESRRSRRYR